MVDPVAGRFAQQLVRRDRPVVYNPLLRPRHRPLQLPHLRHYYILYATLLPLYYPDPIPDIPLHRRIPYDRGVLIEHPLPEPRLYRHR